MPAFNQIHIDRALTNISVAYMQDASVFIADKVIPQVPVLKQSDVFFVYRKEDFFRDEARERATGTESAGGNYNIDQAPPYFCKVYAYHKDVDERERANSDIPLNPDRDATEFVAQKLLIKREVLWAQTFFAAGIWATDITGADPTDAGTTLANRKIGYWDNPLSRPIEDMAALTTFIAENTGYRPNILVLAPYVYDAIRNHPDVLDRIKYTQKGIATTDLLAELFNVEQVYVPYAIENTQAMGLTGQMSFIMPKKGALLLYTPASPGIKKPSAGYIFTWVGLKGSGAYGNRIIRIPMPWLGMDTERIEGEMAFDMKVVSKDLGMYFNNIIQDLPQYA